MEDDLAEIALNSFEASENEANEQEETNAQGSESDSDAPEEEKDNNTNEEPENTSEDDSEGSEEDSDKDSEEENEKQEEEEDKKDIDDEEFDKQARKRGYSKKSEQVAERQRQREDRNALANATRKPKEVDEDTWDNMPTINKVIYNQLPYITAVGKDGNTIKVKTPQQLPDDFEFASKKAELQFQSDIQEQTVRAERANNHIQQSISNMKMEQQKTAMARMIVSEVEALQKSGELPTPKAKPNTKAFDEDEAVILTNKVLNYYEQRRANGDRMSIRDALILYKTMNPEEFKNKTEVKGDAERKKVAKKISGVNKSADTSTTKHNKTKYFRPGMDVQDILDRALEDME